mgnify:CR=1 FL=1
MLMIAIVRTVRPGRLLVRDLATGQNVVVNTNQARRFFPGDRVSIFYNGVMTQSIPPQISAIRIRRLSICRNCR